VRRAAALGYQAIAITDECSLAGIVRAHVAAREAGIKLLVGSELVLEDGLRLLLLATGREGYGNLCSLLTRARRAAEKGSYFVQREDLEHNQQGCLALLIPNPRAIEEVEPNAQWLSQHFKQRCWIAVELYRSFNDARVLAELRRIGAAC